MNYFIYALLFNGLGKFSSCNSFNCKMCNNMEKKPYVCEDSLPKSPYTKDNCSCNNHTHDGCNNDSIEPRVFPPRGNNACN